MRYITNSEGIQKIKLATQINRVALFVVYFWFGLLKVLGLSPAEELVSNLFEQTLSNFFAQSSFVSSFGLFEMLLACIWLFPRYTRIAFIIFCFHISATFLPLIFLADATWQGFMTLTLVGQYIVKNVVLIGSAYFIYSFEKLKVNELSMDKNQVKIKELTFN